MPLTTKTRPANIQSSQWLVPAAMRDVADLEELSDDQLLQLGNIGHAYYRGPQDHGFERLPLDKAIGIASNHIRQHDVEQLAFLTSGVNSSDEDLYVFSKWAHAMGIQHLDQWGSGSWSEAAQAFLNTFGTPDSSCMPEDILSGDLILLWGVNIDDWPLAMKEFLIGARARGAWVVLVYPVVPESNERARTLKRLFHHPKTSALYDQHIALRPDEHIPFVHALTHHWSHHNRIAESFITRHTQGWEALNASLGPFHPKRAANDAGISERTLTGLFKRLKASTHWVSVLGEQFCVPPNGRDAAQGVLNLHLAAGMVGRRGTGVLNMSGSPACTPTLRFGIDAIHGPDGMEKNAENANIWTEKWAFPVSLKAGMSANQCLRSTREGTLTAAVLMGSFQMPKYLWNEGPGPECRIHISSHLDSSMLAPAAHTIVLPMSVGADPAIFSTPFRIMHFHEPDEGTRGAPRPAWRTLGDLAARTRPHLSGHLKFHKVEDIRAELSQHFDAYTALHKDNKSDWLQWAPPFEGGGFQYMSNKRAAFHPLSTPVNRIPNRSFAVFTLGPENKEQSLIYISEKDIQLLGCHPNQRATIVTPYGTVQGTVVARAQRSGCIWAHNATRLDDPHERQTPGWRPATVQIESTRT